MARPVYRVLAFPEHLNPRVASPDWRPEFVDYLYLGFTNATAFSPTDVMPLARWAKLAMAILPITARQRSAVEVLAELVEREIHAPPGITIPLAPSLGQPGKRVEVKQRQGRSGDAQKPKSVRPIQRQCQLERTDVPNALPARLVSSDA